MLLSLYKAVVDENLEEGTFKESDTKNQLLSYLYVARMSQIPCCTPVTRVGPSWLFSSVLFSVLFDIGRITGS